MAEIKITAHHLRRSAHGSLSIVFNLTGPPPPARTLEAKTVADVKRALTAFAEEIKATGKAWQLSARVSKGRAPNGFDKAYRAQELECNVNEELATDSYVPCRDLSTLV